MTEGIGAKGAALYRLQTIDCRLISPCAPSEAIAACRKYSGGILRGHKKGRSPQAIGAGAEDAAFFSLFTFHFFLRVLRGHQEFFTSLLLNVSNRRLRCGRRAVRAAR